MYRRLAPILGSMLVLTLLPASAIPVAAAPAAKTASGGVTCQGAPGRVLVRYRANATAIQKAASRAAVHGKSLHTYHLVPGLELVSTTLPVGRAVGRLKALRSVAEVQPDCVVHADKVPNDPFFLPNQWGLDNTGLYSGPPLEGAVAGKDINAQAGWDIRTDASSIPVAIIDTGAELTHEDLAANLWTNPGEIPNNGIDDDHNGIVDDVHGANFVPVANGGVATGSPSDDNGHGTHVSGIVGARGNNAKGVTGVAWTASLMPLKVLAADGSGSDSSIVAALEYAAANGAKITNNSYGGSGSDAMLRNAFVAAGNAGMLQVVAAGNDGLDNDTNPSSPAGFRLNSVISVAATDDTDAIADFSNRGATSVDLGAPGVNIGSTWLESVDPFSKYVFDSGTSMATPMVSGVAALVAAQNPGWTPGQLRDWILGTTRPDASLVGKTVTGGVVDLGRALGTPPFSAIVALSQASDTGVSHSDRITNANPLVFNVTFPRSISGLSATDFVSTGAGCVVGTPAPAGTAKTFQVQVTGCASGNVTLALSAKTVLDAKSTSGPASTVTSATVVVDHLAPTVSAPAASLLTAMNLSGTAIRTHLVWTGADGGGAGVGHYELQASTNKGVSWTTVSTTLPNPVANVLEASSGTVEYRARAVDKAGNVGAYVAGPNLTPRLVQETAAGITYSSGWTPASSTSYSGGSVKYATVANKTATYKFTGRSIALVSTRATSRGQVKVYLDNVLQATANLAGATLYRDVAWQKTFASSATHTIKLVIVGTAGHPRVDLDAFVVVS